MLKGLAYKHIYSIFTYICMELILKALMQAANINKFYKTKNTVCHSI